MERTMEYTSGNNYDVAGDGEMQNFSVVLNLTDIKNSSMGRVRCNLKMPSSAELLGDAFAWNGVDITLFVLCTVSVVLSLVLSADTLLYVIRKYNSQKRAVLTLWMVAIYPVFSITSMMAVLIPRSATTCDFVGSMFYAIVQYKFIYLLLDYMGGEKATCDVLDGDASKMKMMTGPFCCCCCCLPQVRFTRRNLLSIKMVVLQTPLVHAAVLILALIFWNDGSHLPGGFGVKNAQFWFSMAAGGSKLVGLYGVNILLTGLRVPLDGFKPMGKFSVFPIMMCCTRLQAFIIGMTTGSFPCAPPLPPAGRAIIFHNSLLALEVFLLAIFGRWLYKRPLPEDFSIDECSTNDSNENETSKLKPSETEIEFLDRVTVA